MTKRRMCDPNEVVVYSGSGVSGLSKREWFAGMALQGLVANSKGTPKIDDLVGDAAYTADALISELNKESK